MAYDCSDLANTVVELLTKLGYSVHHGEEIDDVLVPGLIPEQTWWFTWSNGRTDIETGPSCESELLAWVSALEHWTSNASIPLHVTDTPRPSRGEVSGLIKLVKDSSFDCGEWDPEDDAPYELVCSIAEEYESRLESVIDLLYVGQG